MHRIDISRIDLNLLVVLEVLLEERHVGRTAERLRLSQSATSHALGRLRQLFDDPLFVRHAAGVEPTQRARDIQADLSQALSHVRRVVGPARFDPKMLERTFTVATHEYVVAVLMPKVSTLLLSEAPGVDIRCVGLSYRELTSAFDRGEADFACGAFPGLDVKRLERTPLFADRFIGVVRAGHHALRNGRLDIEAFTELRHVWVSMGSEPYDPVAEAMADQGRRRRIAMTVPSALSVAPVVANSDLVGVMPTRLADSLSGLFQLAMFELPVAINAVTCDLLMPAALTATPEARWLKALLLKAAEL